MCCVLCSGRGGCIDCTAADYCERCIADLCREHCRKKDFIIEDIDDLRKLNDDDLDQIVETTETKQLLLIILKLLKN